MPRSTVETRPCEFCNKPVTRSGREQRGRKFWTCKGRDCSDRLRERLGTWKVSQYGDLTETRLCAACNDPERPITRRLTARNKYQTWYHDGRCRGVGVSHTLIEEGRWVRPKRPRTGDEINCEGCGVLFYRQPAYIVQNRRFHSTGCWNEAQRANQIVKPCEFCGGELRLSLSESNQKYHSKCRWLAKIKRPTGREHNGKPVIMNHQGYLTIYEPTHPRANRSGRVLEHRWIMEQALGRYLETVEQVDHINRDKTDNRLENLQLLSPIEHTRKTNGDRIKRERDALAKLAEYERRFGPLEE
jgi:hypothetical protein